MKKAFLISLCLVFIACKQEKNKNERVSIDELMRVDNKYWWRLDIPRTSKESKNGQHEFFGVIIKNKKGEIIENNAQGTWSDTGEVKVFLWEENSRLDHVILTDTGRSSSSIPLDSFCNPHKTPFRKPLDIGSKIKLGETAYTISTGGPPNKSKEYRISFDFHTFDINDEK